MKNDIGTKALPGLTGTLLLACNEIKQGKLGMVVHAHNPSAQETDAGGLRRVQDWAT